MTKALFTLALIASSFVGASPAKAIGDMPQRPAEFKGYQVGTHAQCNDNYERYGWSEAKKQRCNAYAVKSTRWLFGF